MRPALVLALSLTLAAPAAPESRVGPRVDGPPVTAFEGARDRCALWDAPDGPARAWRTPDGLRLLISSPESRTLAGPDLDRLQGDCAIAHAGAQNDDPAAQDDRVWIAGTHVAPDGRVLALAHAEFHAHRRPGLCAARTYAACWRNAVVELVSDDGGHSFRRRGTVAALPWPLDPGQTRRSGYFNPSNIVARDGWLYALIFAEETRAQRRGVCLIRRPEHGGPADWRAWNGAAFTTRFADAFTENPADPAAHVCASLPGLSSTISSLVWNTAAGRWLAVTPATLRDTDGALRSGVWWTASDDLVRWDRPRLLLAAPLLWRRDCAAPAAFAYPSLIDPSSPAPGFASVDQSFRLYLVRLPLGPGCRTGPARDLIWLPVSWRKP